MCCQRKLGQRAALCYHMEGLLVTRVLRCLSCAVCLVGLARFIGCRGKAPASSSGSETKAEDEKTASGPSKLGDLIKPFTPPPLAELDKTANWEKQTVVDVLATLC